MSVIVFIDGPFPTEEDRALAAEHGTGKFRNGRQQAGWEPHTLAVAVNPSLIPEGFRTCTEEPEAAVEAPVVNPSVPAPKGKKPVFSAPTAPLTPDAE